jgi:hypothetical protein
MTPIEHVEGVARRCVALAAAALFILSACGFSIVGDAQADCEELVVILSKLAERCGGRRLNAEVLKCDDLVISAMTSTDVDECRRWAEQVDCSALHSSDFQTPDVCRFRAIWLP